MKADHVRLTALCEGSEDLMNAMGMRYEVPQLFTDYAAFLSDADIDAVILAVADRVHVPLARQALNAGKHVLVEKPLGVDVDDCERLVAAADKAQRVVQVGFMKRHDPGIQYAKNYIDAGLGRRLSISAWYCDSYFRYELQRTLLPPLIKAEKPVAPQMAAKGNEQDYYLKTHGSHLVDTVQYLGGSIIAVQARLAKQFDCYSWHCLVEMADGAAGHLELTVRIRDEWREGFVVHGENGSVEGRTFFPFFKRPSEVRVTDIRAGESRAPIVPDSDPYERQLEAFARAILHGEPVSCTVQDGLVNAKVLRAIEEAARTGGRIPIL